MAPAASAFRDAPTEAAGALFRLVDVSGLLPRKGSYPARTDRIKRVVVHQTEGGVTPPPRGLINEAEYFIRPPSESGGIEDGRGWPGFAYTFWVPFYPLTAGDGLFIVYRCQPDDVVSNHTRFANGTAVSVAFQGRFKSVEPHPFAGDLSGPQRLLFAPLMQHLLGRYGLGVDAVAPHSAFGKPSCPGFELERCIRDLQGKGTP